MPQSTTSRYTHSRPLHARGALVILKKKSLLRLTIQAGDEGRLIAELQEENAALDSRLEELTKENGALKAELDDLDPQFFQEIEDLKLSHTRLQKKYSELVVLCGDYEKRLATQDGQSNELAGTSTG